ncbi:MAG TPA: ABC transporter permease [Oligoflexia bacterium]|nr:ABC transporter permease [Oligoflexia bacterium]HMP27308.1 ABC transporter permease [Oligoflexia bacterium]
MSNSTTIYKIGGVFLLPFLWWLCADTFAFVSPLLLPNLTTVINRLYSLITTGTITQDLLATMYRWTIGFSLGVTTGTLVGLMLGVSNRLRSFFEFPFEFFRSMPITAIFPLFLIIFGIDDPSKIAMAFTPTFLLMVVNTSYGVLLTDPTRRKVAVVFGATQLQTFRKIIMMDALPQVFVGLRLALTQSLIVVVVSEMFIGTDFGLGQRVYDSYLTNSVSTLYALLIVLGIIGYIFNRLVLLAEAKFVFWAGK